MTSIHQNEVRLTTARVNLKNARHALNISLINAYKNPQPDPLQTALEARNFGQVLEQFQLLDRAQSYNASILDDIRDYRKAVDTSQRMLNRERNARRDTVAELQSLKKQIRSSIAAEKQRYGGLRAKVRRLIEERRQAEIAASQACGGAGRASCRLRLATQAVAVNDIGGVSSSIPRPTPRAELPGRDGAAPGALDGRARPRPTSRSASSARRTSGAALRPAASIAPASSRGPTARPASAASRTSPARSGIPARTSRQGDLAPGDLVFFHGLGHVGMYIGGGNFVHAPHTGDVVKISSLGGYSGYDGAVRISG